MSYANVPQQIKTFLGVMDGDSAPWEVAPNDYRYALNLEGDNVEGQSGSLSSYRGFTNIPNADFVTGKNTCIGSYEDRAGQSCIFFVYNNEGYHGIYRYWLSTQSLERVYKVVYPQGYDSRNPDPLDFSKDSLISGVDLVGELLCWTDAKGQPKEINVVRANNTGKKREFNVYFNPTNNDTVSRTYLLKIWSTVSPGLPIETFTWTSAFPATMNSRVKDFIRNVNSNYFSIADMGDFARVTMASAGAFYLELTQTGVGAVQDSVVPFNFYPDYDPDLSVGYQPLPWDYFHRIKKVPVCGPEAAFERNLSGNTLDVTTPNRTLAYTTSTTNFAWLGFNTPSIDTNGIITVGAWSPTFYPIAPYNPGFEWTTPSAIITMAATGSFTANFTMRWRPQTSWNNSLSLVEVHLAKLPASPTTPPAADYTVYTSMGSAHTPGIYTTIAGGIAIPVTAGDQYGLYIKWTNTIEVDNIDLSGAPVSAGAAKSQISSQCLMFRSAFLYKDYEQSVLSDYSKIPLPLNIQYEDVIDLDFSDRLLSDVRWASQITNVYLFVSDDGGATWNQFKNLPQQNWITPGTATYKYKGTDVRLAIDKAYATKQYDAVPLKSLSQAYIDDRVFDCGITEGYDTPHVSFTVDIYNELAPSGLYTTLKPHPSLTTFRRGYRGFIGIVYYDDYDRKCGVALCENSEINIPYYNENYYANISTAARTFVQLSITSEPPPWATKYRIVRTKDLSQTEYLIYTANTVTNNLSAFTSVINIDNLNTYVASNPLAQVSFNFLAGDRVRYIADEAGVIQTTLIEGVITEVTTNTFTVQWPQGGSVVNPAAGFVFEAYTPGNMVDTVTDLTYSSFYEVGECLEVGWASFNGVYRKYHTSNAKSPSQPVPVNQSYGPSPVNAVVPATVSVYEGGVYCRMRDYLYNTSTAQEFWISDANAYEFAPTKFDGTGRPCVIDTIGQQSIGAAFRFSNQYIIGTQTNGISSVEALNLVAYPDVYGDIRKAVILSNDVLRLIFSNSYQVSVYVNQGIIRQTQGGDNLVSLSDQVAGNSHIIRRSFGTTNPESVVLNEAGYAYGWDNRQGVVWLSGNNDPEAVSAIKMRTIFKKYSNDRIVLDQAGDHVPCIYDLYRQRLYITFNGVGPKQTVNPKATIAVDDLNLTFGYPVIKVQVLNTGLTLYSAVATSAYVNQQAVAGINAYGQGWSAEVDDNGMVVVTAPGISANDFMLGITLDYGSSLNKTYKGQLTGGELGSTAPAFTPVTLVFTLTEKRRGWIHYASFTPEMYGRIGNQVLSFVNGEMWLHDSNDLSNNFYDTSYGTAIRYVMNKDYPKVKIPLSQWYRGKGRFGCVMDVAASDSYPLGQSTEMTPTMFRLEADGYYAPVMRNKKDNRFTDENVAWVNGDVVNGGYIDVTLYSDPSDDSVRLESANTLFMFNENS